MKLTLQPSPMLRQGVTTQRLMLDVLMALVPVLAAAVWCFGVGALLIVGAAALGAAAVEAAVHGRARLLDGSAVLTGVLLGLTLPPSVPLWMALLGGAVAVGLGKLVFGGLGQNPFNPALVGRAFLQAAFPVPLTTWAAPSESLFSVSPSLFAAPMMKSSVDAVSAATPLGAQKFEGVSTAVTDLVIGQVGGSLGETSALVLILVGVWLAWRRVFDWRIPVAIVASVAVFATVLHLVSPEVHPDAAFMVTSGGLLLGAVFMATDPVTSPTTPKGAWIFGIGIGLLVVLIRRYGGLPEGVMYAILLMNAATPLLDRWTQPRPFGRRERA